VDQYGASNGSYFIESACLMIMAVNLLSLTGGSKKAFLLPPAGDGS
jgi:hypothetical protein